jgi:tetratricopeptide (TPR) repeat protein
VFIFCLYAALNTREAIGHLYYNAANVVLVRVITKSDKNAHSASLDLLIRTASLLPGEGSIYVRLGELAYRSGEWEIGDAAWKKAQGLSRSQPLTEEQWRLESLYLARQAMRQGNAGDTVKYLRQALTCRLPELDQQVYEAYELELERALALEYARRWQQRPDQAQWALRASKYYWRTNQPEEAVAWSRVALAVSGPNALSPERRGEAFLLQALSLEKQGDEDRAWPLYEEALRANPRLVIAYLKMIEAAEERGDSDRARTWRSRLVELKPEYPVNQALPQGEEVFYRPPGGGPSDWVWDKTPGSGRWILLGYNLDEDLLEDGVLVPVILFWRVPSGLVAGSRWVATGDHWLQFAEVINLVPNAGFEWDAPANGLLPAGFPYPNYPNQSAENVGIVMAERNGSTTQVVELRNTDQVQTMGLRSLRCPVSDGLYVQGSWVRTIDARANSGRYWTGGGLAYSYVVNPHSSSLPEWTYWAGIARPTPNTSAFEVFLLNWNNSGRAQFDELVMFRLEEMP